MPMVPSARTGGKDGLRMSRAAFAVMVKFSDLLEDFVALVDAVAMQAALEDGNPGKEKALMAHLKAQPQADILIRRWESAARMRPWINEKKQSLVLKLEKEVTKEVRDKKAKELEAEKQKEEQKVEAEEGKEGDKAAGDKKEAEPDQIDSSSKPAKAEQSQEKKDKKAEKPEKEKEADADKTEKEGEKAEGEAASVALTPEEEKYVQEEAYRRLEKQLEEIFTKIETKAQFLIRMHIPLHFRRRDPTRMGEGQLLLLRPPSSFEGLPKPKLDWEGRLKAWKQMQTSKGTIKSLTERKADIWNSGITSILALLQTAIASEQIQKQVEKTYTNSCRRTAGLKIVRDLIAHDAPWSQHNDLVQWFSSALRRNENRLAHYLDDTKGQGLHLEGQSRKYFFEILASLVQRLKSAKDEKHIKTLLTTLKWKYTGRDHRDLADLNIFAVLHRGNGDKDNKLKKAWGRRLQPSLDSIDDQGVSKDVVELFEQLFLAVAGRIVEPDFGGALKLKSPSGAAGAPSLQKAKSVIDENASEVLLGQAFEVIFREIERYIKIISNFKGVDWSVYVRKRNQERKDNAEPEELENEDDLLLDEVEAEDDKEEDKEEDKEANEEEEKSGEVTEETKAPEAAEEPAEEKPSEKEADKKGQAPAGEAAEEKKKEGDGDDEGGEGKKEEKEAEKEEDGDGDGDGEGDEEEKEDKDDPEAAEREEIKSKAKEREEREFKQIPQLYAESFLKRLLRLVEIFTSIATCSSHPLSMVQRVANPYHLSSLLNLMLHASPEVKIMVLKIL